MIRGVATLACCLLITGLGEVPAAADPALGEPAPALTVEALLQSPSMGRASWDRLRGRAVVVEFWGTWCAPCIAALPHWNGLAEQFEGEPVIFLSVTDESERIVSAFLNKRPMRGWVGLDPDRSVFEAYGVNGIPATFLIDAQGVLRGITEPERVTEDVLRTLLRGERIDVSRQQQTVADWLQRVEAGAGSPRCSVIVRPSAGGKARMQMTRDGVFMVAYPPREAMMNAYGIDVGRIIADAPLPEDLHDFLVTASGTQEQRLQLLRNAIELSFGFTTRREVREVPILKLVGSPKPKGGLLENDQGNPGFWHEKGRLDASSFSSSDLARAFELVLGTAVVDETGLVRRYDLHLDWDPQAPDGFQEALHEATGLALVPDRRAIEVLLVEHAQRP